MTTASDSSGHSSSSPVSGDPELVRVARRSELADRQPAAALVEGVDLVIVAFDERVSVFYGRCLHRGALLADGFVRGANLICGLHDWDYRLDSGVSEYNNAERLHKFRAVLEGDEVLVDAAEVRAWAEQHPQPYRRDAYLGAYADPTGTPDERHNRHIQTLASQGVAGIGGHGPVTAMGAPLTTLPSWDDLLLLTAQLARPPLFEEEEVDTRLVIGPKAKKPLELAIPLFVSDMSFGALSFEAKLALAQGAELVGTGIASGEGGMLEEERAANTRYFYELASGRFGWSLERAARCRAFHFKGGQAAKTGVGGHLPGHKVTEKIAAVRGLEPGKSAVSPARFRDLNTPEDFARVADEVREASGGIPIGFKLSAQHVEADLDFALAVGIDYVILDGRGGGTGAAPNVLKDHISVPTIAALARARRHLHAEGHRDVTLIITGGLRTEADFLKALALGADGVAVANSALQAIGCLGMRACHTNNCPVGIATQKEALRARLDVELSARRLANWFEATVHLMKVVARACGYRSLGSFVPEDLCSWKQEAARLAGVRYAGD